MDKIYKCDTRCIWNSVFYDFSMLNNRKCYVKESFSNFESEFLASVTELNSNSFAVVITEKLTSRFLVQNDQIYWDHQLGVMYATTDAAS